MLGLGNTLSGGIVPAAAVAADLTNEYSLAFDGSNDYMEADGGTSMTLDECSYALWIKTNSNASQMPFMLHNKYYCYLSSTGVHTYPLVNSPWGNQTSTTGLTDNAWHFLVVTMEGGSGVSSTWKLYIDGELDMSKTATVSYTVLTSENLKIGRYDADGGSGYTGIYMNGNIDEVSIWKDIILDADAVAALYNSGTPIDLSSDSGNYTSSGDLDHWWRMGDGDTYPSIEDNAGSYDFTMTNMAEDDIVSDVPSA